MKVAIAADFRDLFRPLTDKELAQAKANNLADPEHERIPPVVVWQCGKDWLIVDGHHTHKIRENLRVGGKPVKIRYHKMEFADRAAAMAYAIHAQIGRRNLDASQIAIALARLPKAPRGPKGVGELSANWHETPSRGQLAAEAGVGERTLKRADKVNDHGAQAVKDAVVAGEVSVSDASSVADLPKSEQVEALKKVKRGKAKTLKQAAKEEPDDDPLNADDLIEDETPEDIVKQHNQRIEAFCQKVKKLADECPDLFWLNDGDRRPFFLTKVKNGVETLRAGKCIVCPSCNGEGCKSCKDQGHAPKQHLSSQGLA